MAARHSSQQQGKSFIVDSSWVHTQKKAFRSFANFHLKKRGLEIKNEMEEDLADGILLCNLVEILTGKPVGKYTMLPKLRVQKINNINLALKGIQNARPGIRLMASAEEVCDGKLNMILGMIWTLVTEFHLQKGDNMSAKDALLKWLQQELKDYGGHMDLNAITKDFPNVMKDGKVLNFLIHKRDSSLITIDEVEKKSAADNLEWAISTANKKLGIPRLIDPADILQPVPDEQSLLTYINFFRSTSSNPDLKDGDSSDSSDGEQLNDEVNRLSVQVDELAKGKASIERENEELKENAKKLERKSANVVAMKEAEIADLKLEVEKAKQDVTELKKKEQTIKELKDQNEELNMQLEELKANSQEPKAIVKKMQEKITMLEQEILVLKPEVENRDDGDKDARIKELEERIRELEELLEDKKDPAILATSPSEYYHRIEDIIRKLNRKRGARLRFLNLDGEHRENKKFVAVVMEIRKLVDDVIKELLYNYRDEKGDGDAVPMKERDVIELIERLLSYRKNVKDEKNNFVRECNRLGKLFTKKSKNEKEMETWRITLQDIADNKPETITEDNDDLWDDIEKVRGIIENDSKLKDDIKIARDDRLHAKSVVRSDLNDLTEFINKTINGQEQQRLRKLVRELKEKNRKLESPNCTPAVDRDIRISRQEQERIANVIKIMIRNQKQLFPNKASKQDLHPLVWETIRFLLEENHHLTKDLLMKSNQPRDKINTLKEYFYNGDEVKFKPQSDPFAIAELLKEYLKDRTNPLLTFKRFAEFDRVNDLPDYKVLDAVEECIDDLPKARKATLTHIIYFLSKVAKHSATNNQPDAVLADLFGPLMLCPRHGWFEK